MDGYIYLATASVIVCYNFYAAVIAARVALMLNVCPWLMMRVARHENLQLLLGLMCVTFTVGILKGWSTIEYLPMIMSNPENPITLKPYLWLAANAMEATICVKATIGIKMQTMRRRPGDEHLSVRCAEGCGNIWCEFHNKKRDCGWTINEEA